MNSTTGQLNTQVIANSVRTEKGKPPYVRKAYE